nr:periplasmic heavy metal sensor [uncultured Celeribacter sp.]
MNTTQNAPAKKTSRFHWSRVVLVLSLALNLAVVGVVTGAVLRWNDGKDRVEMMRGARDFGFGPFVGALSEEDRRALGRSFFREAGDPRAARAAVGATFEAMVAQLKSEDFDAATFESLLQQQQSQFAEAQKIGARLVAQQIGQMSAEDRQAYAERLDEMLKRPPHGRHGPEGRDRPEHMKSAD